jgi:ABC-type polysaccharide/polyol phosphate export permease
VYFTLRAASRRGSRAGASAMGLVFAALMIMSGAKRGPSGYAWLAGGHVVVTLFGATMRRSTEITAGR